MSKITIRFKSGRTSEIDDSELPRIRNHFPSVKVVVDTVKPPKAKPKSNAIELTPEEVENLPSEDNPI